MQVDEVFVWVKAFSKAIIYGLDYSRSPYDCWVYQNEVASSSLIYLLLYVDDMLITTMFKYDVKKMKILLSAEFEKQRIWVLLRKFGV